jgi:hypothetical protein
MAERRPAVCHLIRPGQPRATSPGRDMCHRTLIARRRAAMGVQVGSMGVQVGFARRLRKLPWPRSRATSDSSTHSSRSTDSSGRPRMASALQINLGVVAHRAVWGYGVGPPSDLNPQCVLPQRPASAQASEGLAAARLPHRDVFCPQPASHWLRPGCAAVCEPPPASAWAVPAGGITVTRSCFGESVAIAPTIPLEGIIRP